MIYERLKVLAAITSMIAITVTLYAYIVKFETNITIAITLIAVLLAAFTSLFTISVSRRLGYQRQKERIFIIYTIEDLDKVQSLVADLKEKGFNPWLDRNEILPGDIWENSIIKALTESAAALVILSQNFLNKKGFAQKELQFAQEFLQSKDKERSPIIPVRIDDIKVPENLSHIKWVDLFEKNGIDILEKGLTNILKNAPNKPLNRSA